MLISKKRNGKFQICESFRVDKIGPNQNLINVGIHELNKSQLEAFQNFVKLLINSTAYCI